MDKEHEAHLSRVKYQIVQEIDRKYRMGQEEHGGSLWLKQGIIPNILDEVVDLVVYVLTLREQYEKLTVSEGSKLYFTDGGPKPEMCPNCGGSYERRTETSFTNTGGIDKIQYVSSTTPSGIPMGDEPSRPPAGGQDLGGVYVGQPSEHNDRPPHNISTGGVEPINRSTT